MFSYGRATAALLTAALLFFCGCRGNDPEPAGAAPPSSASRAAISGISASGGTSGPDASEPGAGASADGSAGSAAAPRSQVRSSSNAASKKSVSSRRTSSNAAPSTPPAQEIRENETPTPTLVEAIKARNPQALSGTERQIADKVIGIFDSELSPGTTVFEKVLALHNYMCFHYKYDVDGYFENTLTARSYSVAGMVLDELGVCEAYARTFQLFMEVLGVPSKIVTGYADGFYSGMHAWNLIQIDSGWYHVDVTWDDGPLTYDYFMVGDSFISQDHNWNALKFPASPKSYPLDRTSFTVREGTPELFADQFDSSKFKTITLPQSLRVIGPRAFYAAKLTALTIPSGVTRIEDDAFATCDLAQAVLPDSVTYLGARAFERCFFLQSVVIGGGLKEIKEDTFYACMRLETVKIPPNVITIADNIFLSMDYDRITIQCKQGSYAKEYAIKKNIKYKIYS